MILATKRQTSGFGAEPQFKKRSFPPVRRAIWQDLPGLAIRGCVPIAHAMGYYLAPLPGLVAPVSASPKYKVLTDSLDWRALRQFPHFSVARLSRSDFPKLDCRFG
jgi:hypothetical protein